MSDLSDDENVAIAPQLSAHSLAALQEFYSEQVTAMQKLTEAESGLLPLKDFQPQENWQLSQFWYTDATASRLAEEALRVCGDNGRIVCICAPTAYRKIQELKPSTCTVRCLEYDERFKVFGEDFVFYDYRDPVSLPQELKNSFDMAIVDPPFLSEECLCKIALSVRFLAKNKIILCTGAVMADLAHRLLGLKMMKFRPQHSNGLQNEFRCYANYESDLLDQE